MVDTAMFEKSLQRVKDGLGIKHLLGRLSMAETADEHHPIAQALIANYEQQIALRNTPNSKYGSILHVQAELDPHHNPDLAVQEALRYFTPYTYGSLDALRALTRSATLQAAPTPQFIVQPFPFKFLLSLMEQTPAEGGEAGTRQKLVIPDETENIFTLLLPGNEPLGVLAFTNLEQQGDQQTLPVSIHYIQLTPSLPK